MKAIGIISSPHAEGNGATLVREAMNGMYEELARTGIVARSEA